MPPVTFDDLIPGNAAPKGGGVSFDDLIPGRAKPAPAPVTAGGVAKSAGSGALGGLFGYEPDAAMGQGAEWGINLGGMIAKHLGADPAKVDATIAQLQQARKAALPNATERQQATGLYHAPQNEAERVANVAGAMLPNAIAPEGLLAKGLAVALPTIGSEGARTLAEAAGGGPVAQGVASVVGGLAGGLASGGRPGAPAEAEAPVTGVDPSVPVPPKVATAAAQYVASRASNPDPAMVAAAQAGKPVTAAEMLGTSGRTALGALARRPGTTGDTLGPMMAERNAGAPARLQSDFQAATGISPEAAQGDIEALIDARRNGPVKAAYDTALANTPDMNASGGGAQSVAQLMEEPEVRTAFGFAQRKLGSAAIDPQTQAPTAEALDLTKKYLSQMVKRDPLTKQPITTGPEGIGNQFTMDTAQQFTQALRAAIPGYGDALDQAGDYLSLQRAHDLGAKMVLSPNTSVADVTAQLGKLSPAEREAFKGGIASKLFDLGQNGRLSPKTVATPGVVGKMRAALGEGPAKQFLTGAAQEKLLTANANRMAPGVNSPTAEFGAEMAAQDAAHPLVKAAGNIAADTAVGTVMTGGNALLAAKIASVRELGRQLRPFARDIAAGAYGMPQSVRDEAGRILMSEMTPEQVRAYTGLAPALQDRSLRILLRNPAVLGRPSFIASAATALNAGASTARGRKQDRQGRQ